MRLPSCLPPLPQAPRLPLPVVPDRPGLPPAPWLSAVPSLTPLAPAPLPATPLVRSGAPHGRETAAIGACSPSLTLHRCSRVTICTSAPSHLPPPGAPFAAFPETAATKLGGSPAGVISLTASTAGTAHHADSQALPAYLFAEPTPPAYSSANSWGSHVGGAAPAVAHGSVRTAAAHKPVVVDDAADAFAEFDPFKQ